MKNIKIFKRKPSVHAFNFLRKQVGWSELDPKIVKIGIKNSLYTVCAFDGNKIIGHCRLVGDNAMKIYIEELMVHPDYQKQGIGTQLMDNVMKYIRQKYTSGCTIGLFSNKNLEFFYNRFGFKKREENMPGMQLKV